MKRKMEQLRNGKFKYKLPGLILSQDKIHVRLKPGEKVQSELCFGAEDETKIKGYVSASNRRFVPAMESFSGTAIQLPYGIDASGMKPGESCEGTLSLITNIGEYNIPFIIEAEKEQMHTSLGEITDLNSFVNLSKYSYREAFRLFTNPSFPFLLKKENEKILALYQGMSQNPITYQHLEEFLIASGQKKPVKISLKEEKQEFYGVIESIQESVVLLRDGWGHFQIEVETEGDFIEVQKKTISENDFIGSMYQLEFLILGEKLGKGRKFGSILIKSPYETLEYQITVSKNSPLAVQMSAFEKRKRADLFRDYMSLQLNQMEFKTWVEHTEQTLQELTEAGCDYPIYQIYQAYVYYMDDKKEKAAEILIKYQEKVFSRKEMEQAGAYLYACYMAELLTDRWKLVDQLTQIYHQKQESYLLLYFLMQVDEEYKASPIRCAAALQHQYEIGCRSPLLYLEAYNLVVEKDIDLMERMNPFWTQVMLFAGKNKLLTEEVCMRIAYFSGYEKTFSRSLYQTLTMAYAQYPSNDTLEAICKMIMKDNPGNTKYFSWFERAVEQNLHLTRLYECYVESIDERYQKILPKTVRRYFVYNSSLSDSKKAFVYANVVRHKEEDLEVYKNYKQTIYNFAIRKLKEGAMNEDYAVLYQELVASSNEKEVLKALSEVVFANRLYCDDPKIRNVIVCYAQMTEEEIYPCIKGVAYPKIYTEDAVILFQDAQKRRYAATVDYNLRKLFDEEVVERCLKAGARNVGFILYQCSDRNSGKKVSLRNLDAHQSLIECEAFTETYRREIRRRLLVYYVDHARGEEIDEYLRSLNYAEFASVDKKQLMELLIERGMLQEAYNVLCEFGSEGVEAQALVKLCSRMILKEEFDEDDELLSLATEVFMKGLYDEMILHYLMLYYIGPVNFMIKLWENARGFQMDTYRLEEKILAQLIFVEDSTDEGSEVLESYIKQKGQENVILSYLTYLSYEYFVHDKQMTIYAQQCLETAYNRGWRMSMICKVSLLKIYAGREEWSALQQSYIKQLLEECAKYHLCFAFFKQLPADMLTVYQLDDKAIVEYHGNPDARVILNYALDTGLGAELEYQSEPLRNVYQGYFNKTFTLFYGETLHYYFSVEENGASSVTEEKSMTATTSEGENQTRYQMINQIISARLLGKNKVAKKKIQEYQLQEKYVERLFSIEKGQKYE